MHSLMLVSLILFEQFVVQLDDNGAPILRRGWRAEVMGANSGVETRSIRPTREPAETNLCLAFFLA
jgi:hypothetical protein